MSTSSPPSTQYRTPLFTAIFFAVVQSIFTGVLFVTGAQNNNSSLLLAGTITLFVAIASLTSGVLIFRNKVTVGAWVFILAISIGVPLVSLNISGVGWFGLFAIPIFVAWFSSETLAANHFRWVVLIGFGAGITNLIFDLLGNPSRPSIPYANIILPTVTAISIVIIILLLRQRFQSFTLQTKLFNSVSGNCTCPCWGFSLYQ